MRILIYLCLMCCCQFLFSNGLVISNVQYNSGTNQITFTAQWENSFHNGNVNNPTYDGIWVFIKYAPSGGDQWLHADLASANAVSGWSAVIPADKKGVMIWRSTEHYGSVGPQAFTVTLDPLIGSTPDFKVFGIEMIYVDEGPFYAGDGVSTGTFHMNGSVTTPLYITSESALTRGTGAGQFGGGNGSSNISALYPKGYAAFWCMKYKVTNEQVVDFLNCLSRTQQEANVIKDLTGTTWQGEFVYKDPVDNNFTYGTSISCDENIGSGQITFYCDFNKNNPPNSFDDGHTIVAPDLQPAHQRAFLDWSALRPMSVLEFEKLCRGEEILPVPGEYPWGSTAVNYVTNIDNRGEANETVQENGVSMASPFISVRAGIFATATSDRLKSASTFYGIMDIDNLYESQMIGILNQNFSGNLHGDGNLDIFGNSDVMQWVDQRVGENPFGGGVTPISKQKGAVIVILGFRGVRSW